MKQIIAINSATHVESTRNTVNRLSDKQGFKLFDEKGVDVPSYEVFEYLKIREIIIY